MFYKFKLMKTGLKYIGKSETEKNKKGILYVGEDELNRIALDSITNIKDMPNLKGINNGF